ncbi:MAG: ATP-binding protein [Endomicrobiia bacterium]
MDEEKKFLSLVIKKVGRAFGDYKMLSENDKLLIGVSGGKDSVTLLDIMIYKKRFLPFKYEIYVANIDFGFFDNYEAYLKKLEEFLKKHEISYYFIKKTLPGERKNINCFWCSWNRRKEIFLLAKKLGCNKVALGHTLDDVVVTFLMNLFYHGEISTMPPVLEMFKGEITLIRPLVYLTSKETQKYVEYKGLPVFKCKCPYLSKKFSYRNYLENLVEEELQKYWPNIKKNIFNSLKKVKKEYLV